MRLAIDAKWYFNGPPSGKNVVKNIVDNFISKNYNCKIFLILDKKDFYANPSFQVKLKKYNISYILINSSLNFVSTLFFINKKLIKNKIEIVLLQNYIPIFKSKKITYVNYIHDFLFMDYPNFFTKFERVIYNFITFSAKRADHIITISNSEKKRINKHINIDKNRISYVYHGIDDSFKLISKKEKEYVKRKFNLPKDYILYVGRINVRKNLNVLLEALKLLGNDYKLVIVGGAENDKGILKKIELNFKNQVIIMGHLDQKDLSEVLASSSLFVFPSLAEGFGLPPIEAMKSGVPVIVSDIGVHNEICSDSAMYFNKFSPKDLFNKIKTLYEDKEINNQYIYSGIKRASKYNWSESSDSIFSILKNVYVNSKSN